MEQERTPIRTARWLVIINTFGFCVMLFMNGLANALPLNGMTTGEISAFFPNRFVPAGSTFAIWGLIYLQLLVFILYQVWVVFREDSTSMAFLRQIGPWFLISCVANATWIVAWHYLHIELAMVLMVVLLVSLLAIYKRLGIGRRPVPLPKRIAVHATFSVYLGWITVATMANVTALLVHWGWAYLFPGDIFWAIVLLLVATMLGVYMIFHKSDLLFSMVLCWAFWGIYRNQHGVMSGTFSPVALAAFGGMVVLLLRIGIAVILSWRKSDVDII